MFASGSSSPSPYLKEILAVLAPIFNEVPNMVSLTGHTDSFGLNKDDRYSNWELSSERANAARMFLVKSGMRGGKVLKVSGLADRVPLSPDANDPGNRRIAIVVLNKEAQASILKQPLVSTEDELILPKDKNDELNESVKGKGVTGESKPAKSGKSEMIDLPGEAVNKQGVPASSLKEIPVGDNAKGIKEVSKKSSLLEEYNQEKQKAQKSTVPNPKGFDRPWEGQSAR
jgi:hypothetical protein